MNKQIKKIMRNSALQAGHELARGKNTQIETH